MPKFLFLCSLFDAFASLNFSVGNLTRTSTCLAQTRFKDDKFFVQATNPPLASSIIVASLVGIVHVRPANCNKNNSTINCIIKKELAFLTCIRCGLRIRWPRFFFILCATSLEAAVLINSRCGILLGHGLSVNTMLRTKFLSTVKEVMTSTHALSFLRAKPTLLKSAIDMGMCSQAGTPIQLYSSSPSFPIGCPLALNET
ncbi:hypothetical protein TIFTF001_031813 [Ficus carica]|uniref:Secreted protein n=1 Tax=Ficus carica TaxID=3494 RepID=A0AA88J4T3_FICCA|nr:hypothetical protein TIFTF001_031813 [Ficus carica]